MASATAPFDPRKVDLDNVDPATVICYLSGVRTASPGNGDRVGLRIAAIFVVLVSSSLCVLFPILASRVKWLRIPHGMYIFARYFGAGVIVATAFIHLLDPAYRAIGPDTCVGLTGGWAEYSWVPGIVLVSVTVIFLIDFAAERYVERKYGFAHANHNSNDTACAVGGARLHASGCDPLGQAEPDAEGNDKVVSRVPPQCDKRTHQFLHSADQDIIRVPPGNDLEKAYAGDVFENDELSVNRSFHQQIFSFYILEIGVIVHSVIIGLNLGVAEDEFSVLFPVITIHQAFEGLGIGARLSTIPFPQKYRWFQWACCVAYGLTTPVAIAIGVALRSTYTADSFTSKVVSGILDAISAGILIYTGLVELLARDFLFNPEKTSNDKQQVLMLLYLILGAMLMALLGKWA